MLYLIKRKNYCFTNNITLSSSLLFYSKFKTTGKIYRFVEQFEKLTATITDSAHFAAIKLKRCEGRRGCEGAKNTPSTSIGFRYLHFRRGYIKGNLRGGN